MSAFFKQLTGTIPGGVPHRSGHLFQASRYRQFLHIAFVHDVDKDWGTLANSELQTLWLTIRHCLNFSQCAETTRLEETEQKERN